VIGTLRHNFHLKYFRYTAMFLLTIFILTLGGLAKLEWMAPVALGWFFDALLVSVFVFGTVIIFLRFCHHLKEDY
jgi:hypothetical protein